MNNRLSKKHAEFVTLLSEIFQFDHADLDFGVYRILRQRRREIARFLEHDLDQIVRESFTALAGMKKPILQTQLEELKKQIEAGKEFLTQAGVKISEPIYDENGVLIQANLLSTDYGKAYMEKRAQLATLNASEEAISDVYSSLITFFRRYYQDGDYIAKRRRSSREDKYSIPYDGQEVVFHWANKDQYYIKTSEHFTNYRFKLPNAVVVRFIVTSASTAQNNNKSKRYFVFEMIEEKEDEVIIQLQYRLLNEKEENSFGKTKSGNPAKPSQSELNERTYAAVVKSVGDKTVKAYLQKEHGVGQRPLLIYHLARFTARNTTDFFIHKDLGGFLRSELNYYIRNAVLSLHELLNGGQITQLEIQRGRTIHTIGNHIIDLLAQIEDFQKRLYEKKKFVTRTEYVVTMDHVPEELWEEVLENTAQLAEWRDMLGLEHLQSSDGMFSELNNDFLRRHPTLTIDTRYFDEIFKDKLLASIDNLENAINGTCIHSDNWQALNLLLAKYARTIECVFIDPPYNIGGDDFLYIDNYQHSSWISMMADRLSLTHDLLTPNGSVWITISDIEVSNLQMLAHSSLTGLRFVNNVIWEKVYSPRMDAKQFSTSHDTVVVLARDNEWSPNQLTINPDLTQFPHTDEDGEVYRSDPLRKWGKNSLRDDRPNLFFPITAPTGEIIYPIKPDGRESCWRWQKSTVESKYEQLDWLDKGNGLQPYVRQYAKTSNSRPPETIWKYDQVGSTHEAQERLKALFQTSNFGTPKPPKLIEHTLKIAGGSSTFLLDFFAGSGTSGESVISLNRQDKGQRKYVLVEMGNHFYTVLLPRLRKVVLSAEWKDGLPQTHNQTGSHIIQYHTLEQYEDTLNSLELQPLTLPNTPQNQPQLDLILRDEHAYLLRYMLDIESRDSNSLLNVQQLTAPFSYTLNVHNGLDAEQVSVDLITTFNYLIGLVVRQRKAFEREGRRYVAIRGEWAGQDTLIVWRDVPLVADDLVEERQADAQFIGEIVIPAFYAPALSPVRLLVNHAALPVPVPQVKQPVTAESLDPIFQEAMFA